MTYHKEEYTLHNGKKIYAEYNEYNICQVTKECIEMLIDLYQQGRVDAIEEFIHECDKYCGFYSGKNKNITREDILKIAEKLKGAEINDIYGVYYRD